MYRGGQLRDISEVSEVGVKTIRQFHHLGPWSSSPSADHCPSRYVATKVDRFAYIIRHNK